MAKSIRVLLALAVALTAVTIVSPATAQVHDGPAGETGRVVIGYSSTHDARAVYSRAVGEGARVAARRPHRSLVATPPVSMTRAEFMARMRRVPGVAFVEPEHFMRVSYVPNDPMYGPFQWGPRRIGAETAWDVQRGMSRVTVAVVDSGVDYAHSDLTGRIDSTNATDLIDGAQAHDGLGHGTHVAGIIAANAGNGAYIAGVAPSATIMPVRVLDAQGVGTDAGVAAGIEWAADHGADVINLSLGGTASSTVLAQACAYARAKDCVVVAAAGNGAASSDWARGTIQFPAAYPGVLAVGAVDAADARASFSQYGADLDLVAPGVGIRSLYPGEAFADLQGTSMATPHVAAVAALIRSQNPTWTASQVERRLVETAEDLGSVGKDAFFGSGLVRADVALGSVHTNLAIAAPASVAWGRSAAIRGTITTEAGRPLAGVRLRVEAKPEGSSTWTVVAEGVSDLAGAYSASVRPLRQTRYRLSFAGRATYLPATSADVIIAPRAFLTAPSAPSNVPRGAYFSSAGLLLPRHTAGHCDVKLYCYRLESGAWRLRKTVWARNANYYSYTRYSARLLLPSAGRWKIVARISGDTAHATTYSVPRYVSVR